MKRIELLTGHNLKTETVRYIADVYEQPRVRVVAWRLFHKFVEPFVERHADRINPYYKRWHKFTTKCNDDCATMTWTDTGETDQICSRGPIEYDIDLICFDLSSKSAKLVHRFDVNRATYVELGGKYADA